MRAFTITPQKLKKVSDIAGVGWIPLNRLMLCMNCDVCFPFGETACPACGSDKYLPLSRFFAEKRRPRFTP